MIDSRNVSLLLLLMKNKFNDLESPIECNNLIILGIGHIVIFFGSLSFNSYILWNYLMNKRDSSSSIDIFVAVMSFLNFIGSLIEIPYCILAMFHCRYIFKPIACKITAFIMYFIGCSTIHLMTAISIERYYTIKNTLTNNRISNNTKLKIIAFCLFCGLFWAVLPLIGWSRYTLEKSLTTCSLVWDDESIESFSYNVSIFIFVYLIPLIIMITIYIRLIKSKSTFRA